MVSTRLSEKKRRSSTASTQGENKKHKSPSVSVVNVPDASPMGHFCQILELGSAFIWDYLSSSDVLTLLNTLPGELSEGFANKVTLKEIQSFVVENKTHLGRKCGCDWMRRRDFIPRSKDTCMDASPYVLDENLPILRVPGGPRAFLNALVLTKKLMEQVTRQDRNAATFAPVICPLVSEKKKLRLAECTESDVKRVLNEIYRNTGTRFFKEFKGKRGRSDTDFLDYHWDRIKDYGCGYCNATTPPKKKSGLYRIRAFKKIRSNCSAVYRPLKVAMTKNLQFVRFVPRPRGAQDHGAYEGLAAGITENGILCGVYLVTGHQP
ncbi:hypothetical protein V7S43_001527 [Phytophthora oleae]|uniref:PiggyBac transposable element-derived protein domain-containing protein n=1 Tax=Phytophthora oleae TaxID=2107226 RepID=A0ABD3G4F3_9STRA